MDWHKNEEINPVELEGSNCRIYGLKEKNKKATTYNKSQFRRQKTGNKKEHELTPTRPASSQYLERIPRMYADDTHLTYADSDVNAIISCLNEDLQNISEWLIANKLTLNMTKTVFMLIGSRQKLRTLTATLILTISGTHINKVATSISLGIFK